MIDNRSSNDHGRGNGNDHGNGRGNGSSNNKSYNMDTITFLRLMFVGLSVACLMQLTYQHAGGGGSSMFGCTTGYYLNNDGKLSSNLRRPIQIDLDVPRMNYSEAHSADQEDLIPIPNPIIPKFSIDPLFKTEQDRIDNGIDDEARCAQYGVKALPDHDKKQRRIFFGSMLADENMEVIVAHAIEVYDKYSIVAFVESNTTHFATPRTMNFGPGSTSARTLQESELFGTQDNTKVIIDYWLEDEPELRYMDREVEQRNTIWKIWIDQGMTKHDVGIMSDLDEVVSRDFLNAIQVCDFPKLRQHTTTSDSDDPNQQRPSCQTPKMILSTIQFESSPLCVKKNEWHHPDIILGNCILGVGNPSGRVTPERTHHANGKDIKTKGRRAKNWGSEDYNHYPQDVIDNNRFPLWDGRDIRGANGSNESLVNIVDARDKGMGETSVYGTAYHFHNWFKDLEVMRHKYATYGHANKDATHRPLSKIAGDLDMLVRCARGLGNDVPEEIGKMSNDAYPYYENNQLLPLQKQTKEGGGGGGGDNELDGDNKEQASSFFTLGGNRPIYFQNRTYVEERDALVKRLIRTDEDKHGSVYI